MGVGLYAHIPFCVSRCHYCDFASSAGLGRTWQERYRAALRMEMGMRRGEYPGANASSLRESHIRMDTQEAVDGEGEIQQTGRSRRFARPSSIYIGGGTPTYLDRDILEGILADLASAYSDAAGWQSNGGRQTDAGCPQEYTVEANPGTLTTDKLSILRSAGCNRLSIGAQSFDDRRLAWLGRIHSAAEFRQAWGAAREAGFANMSLDLMYGLPDQTAGEWRRTLQEALACQPEHISLYQLNIEQGTVLARREEDGEQCTASEESYRAQYLLAHHVLTEAGYLHYEISNYAKPGYESRHNMLYWRNGQYLGLGAGASGYVCGRRYTNKADLAAYQADLEAGTLPVEEEEAITPEIAMAEEMMLAFRLREGVDREDFKKRWGLRLEEQYESTLARCIRAKVLEDRDGRLSPTVEGWLTYNTWVQDFL
ncbi:MAG: radical SAM family heme chaperone HemW [Clostridiales bacterium]|nr:radical SAM family heme chaperone HemW [Clostridiales bacterium]